MPAVVEANPNAFLVIVGRNTAEPLEGLARELGVADRICLTGSISPPLRDKTLTDWVAGLYQQARVYVSAGISEGAEGLSLALLDGMASGLTVVATEISGNRDVIRAEETGILVPPREPEALSKALVCALADNADNKRLSANAKALALQYDWLEIGRRYVALYEELLAG